MHLKQKTVKSTYVQIRTRYVVRPSAETGGTAYQEGNKLNKSKREKQQKSTPENTQTRQQRGVAKEKQTQPTRTMNMYADERSATKERTGKKEGTYENRQIGHWGKTYRKARNPGGPTQRCYLRPWEGKHQDDDGQTQTRVPWAPPPA